MYSAMSHILFEKPHSLSYQAEIFPIFFPTTLVKFESIIDSLSDDLIVVSELDFVNVKDLKQLGPSLHNKDLHNEIILFFVKDKAKYSIMIHVPKKYQTKYYRSLYICTNKENFKFYKQKNKSYNFNICWKSWRCWKRSYS